MSLTAPAARPAALRPWTVDWTAQDLVAARTLVEALPFQDPPRRRGGPTAVAFTSEALASWAEAEPRVRAAAAVLAVGARRGVPATPAADALPLTDALALLSARAGWSDVDPTDEATVEVLAAGVLTTLCAAGHNVAALAAEDVIAADPLLDDVTAGHVASWVEAADAGQRATLLHRGLARAVAGWTRRRVFGQTVPATIRALRRDAGLTQTALGEATGVVLRTVIRWEKGEVRTDAATARRIQEACGGERPD